MKERLKGVVKKKEKWCEREKLGKEIWNTMNEEKWRKEQEWGRMKEENRVKSSMGINERNNYGKWEREREREREREE